MGKLKWVSIKKIHHLNMLTTNHMKSIIQMII